MAENRSIPVLLVVMNTNKQPQNHHHDTQAFSLILRALLEAYTIHNALPERVSGAPDRTADAADDFVESTNDDFDSTSSESSHTVQPLTVSDNVETHGPPHHQATFQQPDIYALDHQNVHAAFPAQAASLCVLPQEGMDTDNAFDSQFEEIRQHALQLNMNQHAPTIDPPAGPLCNGNWRRPVGFGNALNYQPPAWLADARYHHLGHGRSFANQSELDMDMRGRLGNTPWDHERMHRGGWVDQRYPFSPAWDNRG